MQIISIHLEKPGNFVVREIKSYLPLSVPSALSASIPFCSYSVLPEEQQLTLLNLVKT
jgi:hypothetical protein